MKSSKSTQQFDSVLAFLPFESGTKVSDFDMEQRMIVWSLQDHPMPRIATPLEREVIRARQRGAADIYRLMSRDQFEHEHFVRDGHHLERISGGWLVL